MPSDEKLSASAALDKLMSEITAIDPAKTEPCNVRGTIAVQVSRQSAKNLPNDLKRMEEIFKNPPKKEAEELVDRALAAWGAEMKLDSVAPEEAKNRMKLNEEAGDLKELSTSILVVVARKDTEVQQVLKVVRPGIGYEDRANDLSLLHPQLVKRKEELIGRELMTEEQIDRVGSLAPLLLDKAKGPGEKIAQARILRNQAWTHFIRAWKTVDKHLDFLYHGDIEGRSQYPNLWAAQRTDQSSNQAGQTSEPTPPTAPSP